MTGSLIIHDEPLTPDEAKYAVLRAPLDDGRELVYRDVRRLGTILLLDEKGWAAYDAALGPEPLDPGLTPARFAAIMASSKQAIKKVLMDQRKIVGVGNIYANEALFAAGIDPSKPSSRLTPHQSDAAAVPCAEDPGSRHRIPGHHLPRLPHRHRREGQLPARALRVWP